MITCTYAPNFSRVSTAHCNNGLPAAAAAAAAAAAVAAASTFTSISTFTAIVVAYVGNSITVIVSNCCVFYYNDYCCFC